jgi:antitoxin component YwqK of YwqJK toxin-antitoxin module
MNSFLTKYGNINDVSRYSTYANGALDSLCLDNEIEITTSIGTLIPRYEDLTGRRKNTKCLTFYQNGNLKSIDLQEKTTIHTPIGPIACELITFYENGNIKKIFPLNGAINGMWSEEDEIELAPNISLNLFNTSFNLKMNCITFYPTGRLANISFYTGVTPLIPSTYGPIETRIGFSLTESGNLLSLEPNKPCEVNTPLGILHAYDANAIGIHADRNSLIFNPNENNVSELVTSTDIIKITDTTGKFHFLAPTFVESSLVDGETEIIPLKIKFSKDAVTFIGTKEITLSFNDMADIQLSTIPLLHSTCTDCSTCGKCGNL